MANFKGQFSNALGYQTECDLDSPGLLKAEMGPETMNIIQRHNEILRELDARSGKKTAQDSRAAYEILFGEAWVRGVLDNSIDPEGDEKERKRIIDGIQGKPPKDATVIEPHLAMSLGARIERVAKSGRCTPAELSRMSVASSVDQEIFVQSREAVPAGTMGPDRTFEDAKAVAAWALGGKKPA